jgi:hypothetical protein
MQGRVNTKYPSMAPLGYWPLPTKARIFVFKFIIEYSSSLRDFGAQVIIGLFLYEDFLKDDILACVET